VKTETRVGLFIVAGLTIFLYLSIHIGEVRFNRDQYVAYLAYFDDTGGIEMKSPVKIAGVNVGWVEKIDLLKGGKAEVTIRVKDTHHLYKSAFVRISQEGLIGAKAIEIDPGDSSAGYLQPGSKLMMPGRSPTTVSDLLEKFRSISHNIDDVTQSIRNVIATEESEQRLDDTLNDIRAASRHAARGTERLANLLEKNDETIERGIENICEAAQTLRDDLPGLSADTQEALGSIDDAAIQAKEMFREADLVIEKVNNGQGFIGKLINEDGMHEDLQDAVKGLKNFVGKANNMIIKVDSHNEAMIDDSDSKGYVDINIYTQSDYFYRVGLASGEIGRFTKSTTYNNYYDSDGREIILPTVNETALTPGVNKYTMAAYAHKTVQAQHSPSKALPTMQVGKRFNDLTFRGGLFEDTFGIGVDYEIPTHSHSFRWVTTLEAFDFFGHNRASADRRAHVKWLNKLFFIRNIYTTFGIDDLISKNTVVPFWGVGLTFNDNDLKYLITHLFGSLK
jgi:phospholipid/cholesterol/gamma-HCH transport system substrate-binding protein